MRFQGLAVEAHVLFHGNFIVGSWNIDNEDIMENYLRGLGSDSDSGSSKNKRESKDDSDEDDSKSNKSAAVKDLVDFLSACH